MRTFKPFCLSVLPRAVDTGRRFDLALSVFVALDLRASAPRLLLEQTLWSFLPVEAPGFIESGIPKLRSEYLVFGQAYAHGPQGPGVPVLRSRVGVRLGGLQKALLVWGERHWDGQQISEPEAFASVPLDWSGAYGGAGFADNPAGRGFDARLQGDTAIDRLAPPLPLPHFEDTACPWQPQADGNRCVGFSPIAIDNPRRTRYQGTPDEQWLETRFPGPPADFDGRYHQLAPEDQQFDEPLRGDEAYELHRLHPTQALLQGQLPGIAPQAFIKREGASALEPLPTLLRSVLFFPASQRVVLIWQGQAQTRDAEFSDISHLLVGADRVDAPRPMSHYEAVFAERENRDTGGLAVLREAELLPEGLAFEPQITLDGVAEAPHSFGARAAARRQRDLQALHEKLKAAGHADGAGVVEPAERVMPKDVAGLPKFFADLQVEGDRRIAEAREKGQALQADSAQRVATRQSALAAAGLPAEAPPPAMSFPAQVAELRKLVEAPKAAEAANGQAIEAQAMQGYRLGAHLMPAATRAEQHHRQRQQDWVQERLQSKRPLAGLDLSGADLRDFDFSGLKLDDTLLESALLDGARLDGASFRNAVLAHASLRGAALADVDFSGANLGKADLSGAQAPRARFTGAQCFETDFSQADLREAQLDKTQLKGVRMRQALLNGARFDEAVLYQTDLSGADLSGASALKALFIEAVLTGADLRGLVARQAVFYKVDASGLRWDGASLAGAVFVEGTTLARGRFVQADLRRCVLRHVDMSRCDLRHARLDGALLSRATLKRARMGGASAIGALLMHAVLDRADLRHMNLRDANLSGASALATDLREANLFGADLSRIETDAATQWAGTLDGRVRWYPKAQPAAASSS